MSPMLRQILQEWSDWVKDGARVAGPYATRYQRSLKGSAPIIPDRDTGLCFFVSQRGSQLRDELFTHGEHPKYELTDMFHADGLGTNYPFNVDMAEYDEATRLGTHHRNQKRIAWVRAKLEAS